MKVSPGTRAGRRLKFRVIARMAGEHEYRRVDFQRAVERGILERGDHTWRLEEEDADVELWATMIDAEFFLTVRLSDDKMRHREYKSGASPGVVARVECGGARDGCRSRARTTSCSIRFAARARY